MTLTPFERLEVDQLARPFASAARARLACVSETADGLTAHVDHFLLRLPRRS